MADSPFAESTVPFEDEADLPKVMDLVSKMVAEVQKDFVQYIVGGLAPGLALLVLSFGAVFLIYPLMFLGSLPGIAMDDEGLVALGMVASTSLSLFVLIGLLFVAVVPISASLYRAVWAMLLRGEKLTFGSAFSTATQDLPMVYGYSALAGLAVLVGLSFCYLPGLLVQGMLVFGFPAVVIHRLSPGAAVSLSMNHAMKFPSWHVGFFLANLLLGFVLAYIPLIGTMLALTIQPLFVLMAYRACFGEGDVPRGA